MNLKKILWSGRFIVIIVMVVLGVFEWRSVDKYFQNKLKHSKQVSVESSESSNGIPKGYTIEYNEASRKYRWCHGSGWSKWCSYLTHDTKEETIRWLDAYQREVDSEKENNWKTSK